MNEKKRKETTQLQQIARLKGLCLAVHTGLDVATTDVSTLHASDSGLGILWGTKLDSTPSTALAVVAGGDFASRWVVSGKLSLELLRGGGPREVGNEDGRAGEVGIWLAWGLFLGGWSTVHADFKVASLEVDTVERYDGVVGGLS